MQKTKYLIPLNHRQDKYTHIIDEKITSANSPDLDIIASLCRDLRIDSNNTAVIFHRLKDQIASFEEQQHKRHMLELVLLLKGFQELSGKTIDWTSHNRKSLKIPEFCLKIPEKFLREAANEVIRRDAPFLVPITEKENQYLLSKKIANLDNGTLVIETLCRDLKILDKIRIDFITFILKTHIGSYNAQAYNQRTAELIYLLKRFKALSSQKITYRAGNETYQITMPEFNFEIPEEILRAAEDELRFKKELYLVREIFGKLLIQTAGTYDQYELNKRIGKVNISGKDLITFLSIDLKINSAAITESIITSLKTQIRLYDAQPYDQRTLELVVLLKSCQEFSGQKATYEVKNKIYKITIPKFNLAIPEEILQAAEDELKFCKQPHVIQDFLKYFLIPIEGKENQYELNKKITKINITGEDLIIILSIDLKINNSEAISIVTSALKIQTELYDAQPYDQRTAELVYLLKSFKMLSAQTITRRVENTNFQIIMPEFNFEIPEEILRAAEDELKFKKDPNVIQSVLGNFLIPIEGKENQYKINKRITKINITGRDLINLISMDLKINNSEAINIIASALRIQTKLYDRQLHNKKTAELIYLLKSFRKFSGKQTYQITMPKFCFGIPEEILPVPEDTIPEFNFEIPEEILPVPEDTIPEFNFEIPEEILQAAEDELKFKKDPDVIQSVLGNFLMPIEGTYDQYELNKRIRKLNITGENLITLLSVNLNINNNETIEFIISTLKTQITLYDRQAYDRRTAELVYLLKAYQEFSGKIIVREKSGYSDIFQFPEFNFEMPEEISRAAEDELKFKKDPDVIQSVLGKFLIPIEGKENQYELDKRIGKINIKGKNLITLLFMNLNINSDTITKVIIPALETQIESYDEQPYDQRRPELVFLLKSCQKFSRQKITRKVGNKTYKITIPEFNFEIPEEILPAADEVENMRNQYSDHPMNTQGGVRACQSFTGEDTKPTSIMDLFALFNSNSEAFQGVVLNRLSNPTAKQKDEVIRLEKVLRHFANQNSDGKFSQEQMERLKNNSVFIEFIENIPLLPVSWVERINSEEQNLSNEVLGIS